MAQPAHDVHAVVRRLATVLTATTTVSDGVQTAAVALRAAPGQAAPTGWLLIKVGDGVVAQVRAKDGAATASWSASAGDAVLTITYAGDELYAPASRTVAR